MTIITTPPDPASGNGVSTEIPPERIVVAAVVEWRGKIALFRRSRLIGNDSGMWHCISGFVEPGVTPQEQVVAELFEEAGLQAEDISDLRQGPVLVLADGRGASWLVHTFTAVTNRRRLCLNWEHDSYRWTTAQKGKRFTNRVSWLEDVLGATGHLAPFFRDKRGTENCTAEGFRGKAAGNQHKSQQGTR
ncbi:NUDIX domain-containing protein [Paenarthrobacter aurescens]|uniref:NUDIX domain-containing protein n=1 Tax=Paenarthrobacter aurescens TaxID=43663 RepID=UPI0035EB9207